jgi:acyl-CoA thioesterase-1
VLLEIGGNDLLANTAPREFERGLNELLRAVCQPGRTVVMFELPLPPSYNQFGIIQRRCSRAHGVLLIPKRVLLGVLRADATTLDSIHLSPAGHQRMAQAVWRVIHPAFDDEPAIQQRPVGE